MRDQHIPKWKQLGLKLKRAKESPDITEPLRLHENQTLVGSQDAQELVSEIRRSKKRKRSQRPADTTSKEAGGIPPSRSPDDGHHLRKTVSFTPETKQEDGESNKVFAQFGRLQQNGSAAHSVQPTPELGENSASLTKSRDRKNRSEKPNPSLNTQKPAIALEYLRQFQQDPSAWKFNKNREVWILKHALSFEDVPSDYEASLFQYLRGLRSVGARDRLIRQCLKILKRDDESMDSRGKIDEKADNHALKHPAYQRIEDSHSSDSSRSIYRAQKILQCFPEDAQANVKVTSEASTMPDKEQSETKPSLNRKRKKNKIRTAVVEDSSSTTTSSGNDSESSS